MIQGLVAVRARTAAYDVYGVGWILERFGFVGNEGQDNLFHFQTGAAVGAEGSGLIHTALWASLHQGDGDGFGQNGVQLIRDH